MPKGLLHNMDFPESEYRARIDRAKGLMEEAGLDALMITGDYQAAQNYRYFSGHLPRDYQSNSARTHTFLLTREGGAAISVHFFSAATAEQCWVENVHVYTQPFGPDDILTLFRTLGVSTGRVGAELGLDQRMMLPFNDYDAVKAKVPDVEFVDATPLIWSMRQIKSPAEVDSIRTADGMNGRALAKAFDRAEIGMSERQVYDLVAHALIEEGSNRPPFAQMTISSSARARGSASSYSFSGPSDQRLERGDIIFIDSGAIHNGYWGEFNRMAVMGEPSDQQREWHDKVRGIVMGTAQEVLRPGITCRQAMEECIGLYQRAGLGEDQYSAYLEFPYFHICHGLGLEASELPLVRMTDDTLIKENMVFSIEAYVRGHDILYGCEEDVVVTSNGCTLLSTPDAGLYTISAAG